MKIVIQTTIFNLNEITGSISQYNDQSHSMFVRWAQFCNEQNTHQYICTKKIDLKEHSYMCMHNSNYEIEYFWYSISKSFWCYVTIHYALCDCFCKSLRNTHQTHTEYDWSVYCLTFCLICKFHWVRRSNQHLNRNGRVKILDCLLKRSVKLFEKW